MYEEVIQERGAQEDEPYLKSLIQATKKRGPERVAPLFYDWRWNQVKWVERVLMAVSAEMRR